MVTHFFRSLRRFSAVLARVVRRHEFQALIVMSILLLLIGGAFYHRIEGWSYFDSVYFSTTTLLTIGFGDFVPTTTASKLFTILYSLIGVGILIGLVTSSAQELRKEYAERLEQVAEEVEEEAEEVAAVAKKLEKKK